MKRYALFIGLVLLCTTIVFAQNTHYLDVLDKDDYFIGRDGKIEQNCNSCEMKLELCNRGDNTDNELALKYYNTHGQLSSFSDHATDLQVWKRLSFDFDNGSVDTWNKTDLDAVRRGADKLNADTCSEVRLTFNMKEGSSFDIVPRFNNKDYFEYAWFTGPEAGNGGLYFAFDENASSGTLHGDALGGNQYNCTVNGNPTWSNSNSWVYVNSSATFPYGRVDFDGTGDGCDIVGSSSDLAVTTSTSFHMRAWFSRDNSGADYTKVLSLQGTTGAYAILMANTGATSDNICFFARGDSSSNAKSWCSTTDIEGDGKHLVIASYDADNDRFYMQVDDSLEVNVSESTGWAMTFDNSRMNIGTDYAGGSNWPGEIDEVVFQKTHLSFEDMDLIWNVEHASSEITGTDPADSINSGSVWSHNYYFEDAFDQANLTAYVNDSQFDINSTGYINASNLLPSDVVSVQANVTDGYGNWYTDTFTITVSGNATEESANTAIDQGIKASNAWPLVTTYTDQQVYLRDVNNNQLLATVDYVVVSGNQRWLINYGTSPLGLFNITPIVYSLDMSNSDLNSIRSEVTSVIDATLQ